MQLGYTRIGSHRADIHVHWRSNEASKDNSNHREGTIHANNAPKIDVVMKLPIIKEQAANVLSRGEKKLLITALRLSQLPLLLNVKNQLLHNKKAIEFHHKRLSNDEANPRPTPVVLLDDITAELDDRAIDILLSTLSQLPCQVFMTSLTADVLPLVNKYWPDHQRFHVRQGSISAL